MPTNTTTNQSWKPTKKWFGALVGGVGAILVHVAGTEFTFGDTEEGMVLSLVSALVLAYIRRNDPTVGGVPAA